MPRLVTSYRMSMFRWRFALFEAQGIDRIQISGFPCGKHSENDAYAGRYNKSENYRPKRYVGRQRRISIDDTAQYFADRNTECAPDRCQYHSLDKKLREDTGFPGTDGFSDADLLCSLGNRYEHDVHHPDPPDHECYR